MERLALDEIAVVEVRCGDGKLRHDNCGDEYPCVRRLRYRRLVALLYLQGFEATFESMLGESDAILGVPRLQELVQRGQWRDALRYLSRFLPPPDDSEERRPPLSVEAEVLHRFLAVHMALADIGAGIDDKSAVYCQFLSHDRAVCRGAVRLRSIIFSILYARQQYRASIDWECVRNKASGIVYDLVYRTPELKDQVFIPARLVNPHQVLPIGFGFFRRSHSRNEIRRRIHSRSRTRRRRACALAKVYLKEPRSLPAISDPSQESCDELSVSKALDSVADLIDECLKAGKRPESHHVCPIQTSGTEDIEGKKQKLELAAPDVPRVNYLKDIGQDIDKVKSMVNDLCVVSSKASKESLQNNINAILENIRTKVAQFANSARSQGLSSTTFNFGSSSMMTPAADGTAWR